MATEKSDFDRKGGLSEAERCEHVRDDGRNEDPITGEPGAHPVGAGLGAAAGGAAAGAAVGAVAGPVGAAVGIVAGGLAGGWAGKEIAERFDPTIEEHHWRNEYPNRDYYDEHVGYEQIGPAYQHGWESRARYHDQSWDEAEADLAHDWNNKRGRTSLDWQRARPAARDAWERIEMIAVREVDEDTGQCEVKEKHREPRPRTPK